MLSTLFLPDQLEQIEKFVGLCLHRPILILSETFIPVALHVPVTAETAIPIPLTQHHFVLSSQSDHPGRD